MSNRVVVRIATLAKMGIQFSVTELAEPHPNCGVYANDCRRAFHNVSIRYYPWAGVASVEDAIDQVLSEAEGYVKIKRRDCGK